MGKALKKDIWIDGKCTGESALDVFFHTELTPGNHTLSTKSEFSPNDLTILVEAGKTYFYRQLIRLGLIVGASDLESIPEDQGKAAIARLQPATAGTCSKSYTK